MVVHFTFCGRASMHVHSAPKTTTKRSSALASREYRYCFAGLSTFPTLFPRQVNCSCNTNTENIWRIPDMWLKQIFVVFQRTTYVWQQPLQCYGGESLPAQKVSACVSLDFWLKFGVSTGTIAAALLISLSCYFWKKTRKWGSELLFLLEHWYVIQVLEMKPKALANLKIPTMKVYMDKMFIPSLSACRLQYKYSKLMMSSGGKECDLPTADSCAIMEGEDAEDDVMYLTKKSFFTKMRSYSREVSDPSV